MAPADILQNLRLALASEALCEGEEGEAGVVRTPGILPIAWRVLPIYLLHYVYSLCTTGILSTLLIFAEHFLFSLKYLHCLYAACIRSLRGRRRGTRHASKAKRGGAAWCARLVPSTLPVLSL